MERSCYVDTAKYCIEEILTFSDIQQVNVLSTDLARYYEEDKCILSSSVTLDIFDLNKSKVENDSKWNSGYIRKLFRKVLSLYIETLVQAKLCISAQSGNEELSFEIPLELKPKYIPLGSDFEVKDLEFFMESAVGISSLDIQNFQGKPWIGYSGSDEFLQLYNDAMCRRYAMICSCTFNVESNEQINYPIYYCFIPGDNHQQNFLIKVIHIQRVLSSEDIHSIDLPSRLIQQTNYSFADFLNESLTIKPFVGTDYQSGMHQQIIAKGLQTQTKLPLPETAFPPLIPKLTTSFSSGAQKRRNSSRECLENIASALRSNRKRRIT